MQLTGPGSAQLEIAKVNHCVLITPELIKFHSLLPDDVLTLTLDIKISRYLSVSLGTAKM